MANLFFQGKLIRQFWGKINRQSTVKDKKEGKNMRRICLQYVTWGGGQFSSNLVTLFHSALRIE